MLEHITSDLKRQVETKDIRISVLEAELASLKTSSEVIIEETAIETIDLSDIINKLAKKVEAGMNELTKKESELFFAELRASMAALQQATKEITHMDTVRKLDAALEMSTSEIVALKKQQRSTEQLELELNQTKQNLLRRDEEIEFLSHVHEASNGYDWTNNHSLVTNGNLSGEIDLNRGEVFASGSAGRAVSILTKPAKSFGESVMFLAELGATEEAAIQVLESVRGDVDRAALILFP